LFGQLPQPSTGGSINAKNINSGGGSIFGLGADANTSNNLNQQQQLGTTGTTTGSSLFTNPFSQQQPQQQQQQQPLSSSNLFSSRPNTLSSTTGIGTGSVCQLEAQRSGAIP
jgi:hypothetical protein